MLYKDTNDYELIYLIAEKNEDAYNTMYKKYYNLVLLISSRYYGTHKNIGLDYNDIVQAGTCGLLKAINCYDDQIKAKFYTCAVIFIKREIERLVKDNSRLKHSFVNQAISLQQNAYQDGDMCIEEMIGNNDIEQAYRSYMDEKTIVDYKYCFDGIQAQVYELKINGFSNKEIATLLDVKYKMVDNSLLAIRNKLKKCN